jgi:hypothetical protein
MTNEDIKSNSPIQGEGDRESDRRYRKDVKTFLADADPEELAREAAPKSPEEQRELEDAERVGRSHAKGTDKR